MLDTIRTAMPAASRDKVYEIASAFIVLLAGVGVVGAQAASLWTATVVAVLALLYALIHSTSPWRTALYGVVAAVSPLATWYSLGSDQTWAAVVMFAAVVLGVTKAAAKSGTYDAVAGIGRHRAAGQ